jgi:hypothetical protein
MRIKPDKTCGLFETYVDNIEDDQGYADIGYNDL